MGDDVARGVIEFEWFHGGTSIYLGGKQDKCLFLVRALSIRSQVD